MVVLQKRGNRDEKGRENVKTVKTKCGKNKEDHLILVYKKIFIMFEKSLARAR
jgi:hypothetical protein